LEFVYGAGDHTQGFVNNMYMLYHLTTSPTANELRILLIKLSLLSTYSQLLHNVLEQEFIWNGRLGILLFYYWCE
jgi:hypothetical protein